MVSGRSRTNRRVTWYAKPRDYANWLGGGGGGGGCWECVRGVSVAVVWFHVHINLQLKISVETKVLI